MRINTLDELLRAVKDRPRKRLVVAWANDAHTLEAVNAAVEAGLVEAILVGDEAAILKVFGELGLAKERFRIVHTATDTEAASKAVGMVRSGEADLLMKGLLSTDKYMRAILNKEQGLLDPGAILSHVTVMEHPGHPKLMIAGDVAVIPEPEFKEKLAILNYLVKTAKALGIETPKVAVLAASEQVLPKMSSSSDAAMLSKMADRGQIKGALVDGPLALDGAIDPEAAQIKGLVGPVAGDADCLLFPNIEAGNVFYKAGTKLGGAEIAAVVVGARVPCVLSSRGDSAKTKLSSIALAALLA
ncbi:bifunctional enoyl-CoA hydratase/phosphate acetyltransferase [Geothrix sp. PMB-07]|uniref:bifunctional enoyl-CoA hydratase/phosphate acetyltransferase n=1 Tax=Geothrix sp. PMB-07 TaxID=3068640 RepID=UPI0027426662|nr:bifunctional enoyl-CoA hydratase/phosphate acetyltransferase [Geothrix sp. PMB-07]WLT29983.1 bifunctional enoyl-CoA hydratase/phosphate acetyltransferase [Geothrix sp. PMB-07]